MAETMVLFHENGNLFKCTLARNIRVQGLPAKAGSDLCFFENKDLSALDLSEDAVISGHTLPQRYEGLVSQKWRTGRLHPIRRYRHPGNKIYEGKSACLQGRRECYRCQGPLSITCLSTYGNGTVRGRLLSAEETVNGILCRADTWVWFHRNGLLSSCELACNTLSKIYHAGQQQGSIFTKTAGL